jgi:hypothetical protein
MQTKLKLALLILSTLSCLNSYGQDKKEQDQKAIKAMCGCYEVGFNFAETFQYSKDSSYKASANKHAGALEWVELVEDKKDKIVMQHLLIAGKTDSPHIIKHWRQDWLYQNTSFYQYNADNTWKYAQLPGRSVKGQWTQKVYQVDDSPRYEGSATWLHVDGKSYWQNVTDAPLPRREYTKRSDYNVTIRDNRHEITKSGWIHDQDNKKVIRKKGKDDVVLAEEKGYNTYTKVADSRCKAAQKWWKENNQVWGKVRTEWDNLFDKKQDITLKHRVKDKRLYEYMFDLKSEAKNKEIKKVIQSFTK